MSGETFNDAFMLEIFRSEVETHVESLTSGLLALERDPGDTSHIDEMMRGAHSIKGAARIVGIDPAVRIAHVMEDGFIAAQNGKLILRPTHVDTLLRGVDMLNRIANGSKDPEVDWSRFSVETLPLVAEITAVLSGAPAEAPPKPAAPAIMAASPLSTSSTTPEITISLPAMLDFTTAETVRLAFVSGLDSGATLIRFDLSRTEDLDAIGLALLAAIPAQVKSSGPRLELVGASAGMQSVLQATGIDTLYSAGGR